MSNGPGKRQTGPFKLIDIGAEEREDSHIQRLPGPSHQEPEFELTSGWQREVLGALKDVQAGLQGVQAGQGTLESGQAQLFLGQTELTEAFGAQKKALDALVPRVQKLETAARWKVWAVRVAKASALPLSAIVGRYAPELAKHLPELLEFFAKAAADAPLL